MYICVCMYALYMHLTPPMCLISFSVFAHTHPTIQKESSRTHQQSLKMPFIYYLLQRMWSVKEQVTLQ